jgi:hypothetical protein
MTFTEIQFLFLKGESLPPGRIGRDARSRVSTYPAHPHLRMGPRCVVYPQSRINSASVPLATHPAMEYISNNLPDEVARCTMSDQFTEYYAKQLNGSSYLQAHPALSWVTPIGSVC